MSQESVETAWKIHAAICDWTGKVDAKASFALTIESALLAGVLTLSTDGRIFSHLSGWSVAWYVLGLALLVASVACAVWVVRPRLRTPHLASETGGNFIYFGHLRMLDQSAVQRHLESTPVLPVLSKQLVEMSKIAWIKHKLVAASLTLAPLGAVALAVCATYK